MTSFPPESDGEKVENIGKVPPHHETSSSDQVTPRSDQLGRTQFGKRLSIVETETKLQVPTERKVANPRLSVGKLRPWDRLTLLLKLEEAPVRTKEKLNHQDGKTLLEIRKQVRKAPLV